MLGVNSGSPAAGHARGHLPLQGAQLAGRRVGLAAQGGRRGRGCGPPRLEAQAGGAQAAGVLVGPPGACRRAARRDWPGAPASPGAPRSPPGLCPAPPLTPRLGIAALGPGHSLSSGTRGQPRPLPRQPSRQLGARRQWEHLAPTWPAGCALGAGGVSLRGTSLRGPGPLCGAKAGGGPGTPGPFAAGRLSPRRRLVDTRGAGGGRGRDGHGAPPSPPRGAATRRWRQMPPRKVGRGRGGALWGSRAGAGPSVPNQGAWSRGAPWGSPRRRLPWAGLSGAWRPRREVSGGNPAPLRPGLRLAVNFRAFPQQRTLRGPKRTPSSEPFSPNARFSPCACLPVGSQAHLPPLSRLALPS